MTSRGQSYTTFEDIHLCHVWLDVSQNPIIGTNQSKETLWKRVTSKSNKQKPDATMQDRTDRSCHCRMNVILPAINKFRGFVRQVEYSCPSGCAENDIIDKARKLYDKDVGKGFKFDHVWPILKDAEKFSPAGGRSEPLPDYFGSSQSEKDTPDSPGYTSPGLSTFSMILSDEEVGGSKGKRPIGVKRAKLKNKVDAQFTDKLDKILERLEQLITLSEDGNVERKKLLEAMQRRMETDREKLEMQQLQRDEKILLKNLDFISDPNVRVYFEREKTKILQKILQQSSSGTQDMYGGYGSFFNNLGTSGSNLPDY